MKRLLCALLGHHYAFRTSETLHGHPIVCMACRRCGDHEWRWTQ